MCTWLKKYREQAGKTQAEMLEQLNCVSDGHYRRWENCRGEGKGKPVYLLEERHYENLAKALGLPEVTAQVLKREHHLDLQWLQSSKIPVNAREICVALETIQDQEFLSALRDKLNAADLTEAGESIARGLQAGGGAPAEDFLRDTFDPLLRTHIPVAAGKVDRLEAYDHLVAVLAAECMVPDDSLRETGECLVHGSTSASMKRVLIDRALNLPMTKGEPKSAWKLDDATARAAVVSGDNLEIDEKVRCAELVGRLVEIVDYRAGPIPDADQSWDELQEYCHRFSAAYLWNRTNSEEHSFYLLLKEEPDKIKSLLARLLPDARILQHSGERSRNPLARVEIEDRLEGWIAKWRTEINQAKEKTTMKQTTPQFPPTDSGQGTPTGSPNIQSHGDNTTIAVTVGSGSSWSNANHYHPSPQVENLLSELKQHLDPEQPGHLALEAAADRIGAGDSRGRKLLDNATQGVDLTGKVATIVEKLCALF